MRIVRPFYQPEVEERIAAHKLTKSDEDISGDRKFWDKLEREFPDIITWRKLSRLLDFLQQQMTGIYNRSASTIYTVIVGARDDSHRQKHALLAAGISEEKYKTWTTDGKNIGMSSLLSAIGYPEAMEVTQSSVIALGIRQKLQSSFSGENLKELRNSKRSLPTANAERFPIPMYCQQDRESQKGGFKIVENGNGDFILELPFPHFEIDGGKVTIPRSKGLRKPRLSLLLSTKTRRRRGAWQGSEGMDANVRRLMNGEYRTSWIEISRGKSVRDLNKWYVNITFEFEAEKKDLDKSIVGGIDIGVDCPAYCAVSNSLKRLRISSNDVQELTKKQLSRLRQLQRASGPLRTGHGKERKFRPIEDLENRYNLRRKKVMERWAKEISDWFLHERAGIVQMEDLATLQQRIKEGETFFDVQLRLTWPFKEMTDRIKNKLEEHGIEVQLINPKHTSQVCSRCGERNEQFTFEYRTDVKNKVRGAMPPFKCPKCDMETAADYNAAKNIAHWPKHFKQVAEGTST